MKTKIFGILAFVMVALAGTGIAYGHWYDYASVNATIQTGTLIVNLSDDTEPTVTGGCTSCPDWQTTASQTLNDDKNVLTITIDNAQPIVCVNGTFNIENDGTVPAEVASVVWTATDSDSATTGDITFVADGNGGWFLVDDQVKMMDISVSYTDANGNAVMPTSLCPQDAIYVHYQICFLEDLEQNTVFTLTSAWTFQNCESVS